jgi:PAS domain S-box-containing protein
VIFVFLISLLDLIGWIFGINLFKSILPQWEPMKIIPAICLLITSLSLMLIIVNLPAIYRKIMPRILAFIIGLFSLLTLYASLYLSVTGHETSLTELPYLAFMFAPEFRMANLSAFNLLLISFVLLLFTLEKPVAYGIAHLLIIPVALTSYFNTVSYILGVFPVNNFGEISLSLYTSIALLSICTVIFIIKPDTWLIKEFTSLETGSIFARKLLPTLILLPVVIGWLRITGERLSIFRSDEGVVLVVITFTICFLVLIWLTSGYVNKIDRKRQASEEAMRESEDRFRTIAESLPVQISIIRISDSTVRFTNEFYDTTFGFKRNQIFGKPAPDIYFYPDDRTWVLETLMKKGFVDNFETKVRKTDGSPFWIISSIRTVNFEGEPAYLSALIDITEIKEARDELVHLNRILDSHNRSSHIMMHSDNEINYLNEVCKTIIEDCGYAMVWVGYVADDQNQTVKPVATYGFNEGYVEQLNITAADTEQGQGPTGTAIRTGEYVICPDILTNEAFKPWRNEAVKRGYRSSIVLPLMSEGKSFGAVSIYSLDSNPFSDKEVKLLSDLVNDLAYGISYIRLIESEKRSMDIIKASEEKYKQLVTQARSIIINMDNNGNFTFFNEFALDFFGYTSEEILGKSATETILPKSESTGRDLVKMAENLYEDPDKYSLNINENIKKNGELVWIEWHNKSVYDKNGERAGHIAIGIDITERKKIEETLKETEEKLWSVLNAANESIYLFDREGRFTISNATGLKRMGKTSEKEVIGHHFSEFMPAELAMKRQARLEEVFLTGKPLGFEDERGEFIFANNFYPVFKETEVSNVVTYSIDITERKKAEKELQRTKNYLESLINYANAPIIVWNPDNEIRLFNHAFERLTGFSSADIVGKKLDILFPAQSLQESNAKIKLSLTENLQTIEIPIITSRKEIRTVLWNSANIYDNDNKNVLSTIAQGNDITERIKAETEVSKSKEKLDIALESGNIGIWEWNIKEDKFEWDTRMGKMLGSESGSGKKTIFDFERHIYEDDAPHFRNAMSRTIEEDIPFELIYRIKHQEGDISYINTRASIEKDREGVPVKMTGVCFDITEMKRGTEQALFNLNEDLQRSNKELEQFAYVASHDLQEPLRMVSSFTQLLSMRYKDKLDKEAHEFIKFAVDGAFRMQSLINDLLEYSRIGTRGKSLSVTDMNSILGQTLHNLSIIINEKAALVTNDELPAVTADAGQMVQLLQNLIGNALKFCNTSPRIHVSAREENDCYLFAVKDNGIGIEPEYFERIFQIFQRLHPKDEYGGTGIGLAICRRIVERHGGKIWVESIPGEGTVFKFTIRKKEIK